MNNQISHPSFDEYSNWSKWFAFGKEAIIQTYTRPEVVEDTIMLSENEKIIIKENIEKNVVDLCKMYPNVTFYIFIPPYSVCWWDCNQRDGKLEFWIDAERIAIETMLQCDNIKLYSFSNDLSITGNLDNYKDQAHYGEWINEEILNRIAEGKNQLTKDNYVKYLEELRQIYSSYNYEQIYS